MRPEEGGCWYCFSGDGNDWLDSWEFDCNLHLHCLQNEIQKELAEDGMLDCETAIFAREFNLPTYPMRSIPLLKEDVFDRNE